MNKILGLDLGTKTLGIAMSDSIGIPHPVETFHFSNNDYPKAVERVIELVEEHQIGEIALGLPLHMSGDESKMSKAVRDFEQNLLGKKPTLKITLIDERLTSIAAHRALTELGMNSKKQKQVVDMVAASEILDTYIRMKK